MLPWWLNMIEQWLSNPSPDILDNLSHSQENEEQS